MSRFMVVVLSLLLASSCQLPGQRNIPSEYRLRGASEELIEGFTSGASCQVSTLKRLKARGAKMTSSKTTVARSGSRRDYRGRRIAVKIYAGEPAFYMALRSCPDLAAAKFLWPFEVAAKIGGKGRKLAKYLEKWPHVGKNSVLVGWQADKPWLFMLFRQFADSGSKRALRRSVFATLAELERAEYGVVQQSLMHYLVYCSRSSARRAICGSKPGVQLLSQVLNILDGLDVDHSRKERVSERSSERNRKLTDLLAAATLVGRPALAQVVMKRDADLGGRIMLTGTVLRLPPTLHNLSVAEMAELQRLAAKPPHAAGWERIRDALVARGVELGLRGTALKEMSQQNANDLLAKRDADRAKRNEEQERRETDGKGYAWQAAYRKCINSGADANGCKSDPHNTKPARITIRHGSTPLPPSTTGATGDNRSRYCLENPGMCDKNLDCTTVPPGPRCDKGRRTPKPNHGKGACVKRNPGDSCVVQE